MQNIKKTREEISKVERCIDFIAEIDSMGDKVGADITLRNKINNCILGADQWLVMLLVIILASAAFTGCVRSNQQSTDTTLKVSETSDRM